MLNKHPEGVSHENFHFAYLTLSKRQLWCGPHNAPGERKKIYDSLYLSYTHTHVHIHTHTHTRTHAQTHTHTSTLFEYFLKKESHDLKFDRP